MGSTSCHGASCKSSYAEQAPTIRNVREQYLCELYTATTLKSASNPYLMAVKTMKKLLFIVL